MNIVLVPGLWLDAASWDRVVPVLESAGHRAVALTLPGMESPASDRAAVSLGDWVAAVIAAIDSCDPQDGRVLLVAHSAGGGVAHAAVDARADRVARVVYVGGFPTPDGLPVVAGFPSDGPDIALPPWDTFDEADLVDLDEAARDWFRRRSVPSPAALARDPQRLQSAERYAIPATVICPEFTSLALQGWIEQGLEPVRELAGIRHLEYVDLPTGHWPQFTRPEDLGSCIVERAEEPFEDEFGRLHPPIGSGEVLTALGFLDYQRATLGWKAGGLAADGLRVTTADSSLTLGGLLKHMAYVEDHWFSYWLHGQDRAAPWDTVDWSADRDWDFHSAAADDAGELHELWRTAAARSRAHTAAAIAAGGFDRPAARATPQGERLSLRWIVLHMIEEYARHNGHADLLRESIDGATGE